MVRLSALLAPACFAVAIVVLGWQAGCPVLWVDEYLTQRAVARSWPDLVTWITTTDPGPGPYYLLMKVWSAASLDRLWLRLPSVVAMAAALTAVAGLARRLAGLAVGGLTFAVLLALPIVSRFGQENRPYAFALLATVAAVACWLRAVERPGTRRSMVWFGLAVVGMGLAHLYTLTMLAVFGLGCLVRRPGDRVRALVRTVVPALVALVVIIPHVAANLRHPTGSPTDGPLSVESARALLDRMFPTPVAVGLLVLAGLGLGYAVRRPKLRPAALLALGWALVPTAILLAAKVAVDLPVTKSRYLLFVVPAVALLAALGLRQLAAWWRPLALAALALLVLAGLPRQAEIRKVDGHNRDWALGPMLAVAAAHRMPVIAANHQAIRLVDAATFPRTRLSRAAEPRTTPYVVVVERVRYARTVPDDFVFYRGGRGPWRQVLRCPVAQATVMVFQSRWGDRDPDLTPDHIAAQLEIATGGEVRCRRVDALRR